MLISDLFLGIGPHQLICLLFSGKRLNDPEFCPAYISQLLMNCFQQKPNLRPTFLDIKSNLIKEYDALIENSYSKDDANLTHYTKVNPSKMQTQYTTLIKQNNTRRASNEVDVTPENEYLNEDYDSLKYSSLEWEQRPDLSPRSLLRHEITTIQRNEKIQY